MTIESEKKIIEDKIKEIRLDRIKFRSKRRLLLNLKDKIKKGYNLNDLEYFIERFISHNEQILEEMTLLLDDIYDKNYSIKEIKEIKKNMLNRAKQKFNIQKDMLMNKQNKRRSEWGKGWDGKSRTSDETFKKNYDEIDWSYVKQENNKQKGKK